MFKSRNLVSVLLLIIALVFLLQGFECRPQHGGNKAGDRFEYTRFRAAPPVDLNKPPIFLPEFTPIHEDNGEAPPPNSLYRSG
ncbi:uncharacterized protein [Musca autumnalis]|uniref:uncharacterized protein n=1 Tax=Musca autumnalis TaxID=221902 RepID=UPI003CF67AB1